MEYLRNGVLYLVSFPFPFTLTVNCSYLRDPDKP